MVVPFMSIYCIQQLHFTIVQAGTVMALFGIGSIIGAFLGGKVTDKIGFYDLQTGALLSGGLLFVFLGYQHTFYGMAIGTFVLSLCNESFRPANQTAIAHYSTGENRTRSYSLNRLAVNLGWGVGGAIGGFLASINYHLLFWVDGCTNIAAAVLLLTLMPRAKVSKTILIADETIIKVSPYRDKIYLAFIVLATMFGMCFFEFFIMQPVFFKIQWHFSERFIGGLMALNGLLIAVIEMILVHSLEGRRNGLVYIIQGTFFAGMGYAMLNVLPISAISAVVIVIFITFGEMFAMPFMNSFWISRTNPYNRGEYAALYAMSWSLAQILSPFFGSQLIDYGGFYLLWWLLGGLSLVAAIGYWLLYRDTQARQVLQEA